MYATANAFRVVYTLGRVRGREGVGGSGKERGGEGGTERDRERARKIDRKVERQPSRQADRDRQRVDDVTAPSHLSQNT